MNYNDQPQVRVRVNVKSTAKGEHTWDCTFELTEGLPVDFPSFVEAALEQSDALVKALTERYGPQHVETNDRDLLPALEASVKAAQEAKHD